jgi:hypothetical protein
MPSAGVRENDQGVLGKTTLHTSCGKKEGYAYENVNEPTTHDLKHTHRCFFKSQMNF